MNKLDYLYQIPVFQGIKSEELEPLGGMMEEMHIPKYSYIYRQGEMAKYLYFLVQGSVKIGSFNPDGKEMIKHILHPEMLFGEISAFSTEKHRNFAMSFQEDVVLYSVSADRFRELLGNSPELCLRMLSMIGRRLRNAERRLEALVFKDARQRIIDFLKENAMSRGKQIGYETLIRHNLTQQDIASFTCTSRQTVTSVLNDLKKANLIYFNRRSFLIRDLAKLS